MAKTRQNKNEYEDSFFHIRSNKFLNSLKYRKRAIKLILQWEIIEISWFFIFLSEI